MCVCAASSSSSHCTRKRSVNPISVGKVINLHSNLISLLLFSLHLSPGLIHFARCALLVLAPFSYRMQHTSKESNYPIASLHSRVSFFFFFLVGVQQHGRDTHIPEPFFLLCEMMASTTFTSTSGLARLHRLALLLLAVYLNVVSSQGKKRKKNNKIIDPP